MEQITEYRIFLETYGIDKFQVNQCECLIARYLEKLGKPCPNVIFNEVIGEALYNPKTVWAAVLKATEIYADTSLWGASGKYVFSGSPVLFENLMRKAYAETIKGKKVFFVRKKNDIVWQNVDLILFRKLFASRNEFLTGDGEFGAFAKLNLWDGGYQLLKKLKENG